MTTDTESPADAEVAPRPLARWEGLAFMATGAALVAHILVDVPLWLSALGAVGTAAAVLTMAARRHPADTRGGRQVIMIGAVSAAVAMVAYDLTRVVVCEVFDFTVSPFAALPLFGRGLLGPGASHTARWVAGTAFHVTNGVTFGIAYTVLAGRQPTMQRALLTGMGFGLGLEAVMLGLYPAWLQIPNLREFFSMSLCGHLAYGGTLGALSYRNLVRLEARS
jgi:hypothetical protein